MMTSKGTSRLMTTWTGATSNRLNACDLVLGKPSSSQLRSADDKRFNSEPMAFNMSSSGTSCPLETNLSNIINMRLFGIHSYSNEWNNNKRLLVHLDADVGLLPYHVPQNVATGYVKHVEGAHYTFGHRTLSRARGAHDQGS